MEQINATLSDREVDADRVPLFFSGDYNRIYRYIHSMVNDNKEAEDLTQETFLRAFRKQDSLRDQGAQTAWLYKIATHVSLDRLRQFARSAPRESETDLQEVDIAETDTPSVQKITEQNEMSVCVQDYLNRLPDRYRAVILLHDMHDLTAMEISTLLGESLASVKIKLHRARLKLKAALRAGCAFSVDEDSVLTCESK